MIAANDVGDKGGKQESQQKKAAFEKSVPYNIKLFYLIYSKSIKVHVFSHFDLIIVTALKIY